MPSSDRLSFSLASLVSLTCLLGVSSLGGCTKSHDVSLLGSALGNDGGTADVDGAAGGGAGTGAGTGIGVGQAGSGIAGTGAAGGGAGTGTGGIGVAGTGAAGGNPTGCANCMAPMNMFIMAASCCTDTKKCGLDLSQLGISQCLEQNAPGNLDTNCPDQMVMGLTLKGCCRADGTCGGQDTFLGLGCTLSTSGMGKPCGTKPQ